MSVVVVAVVLTALVFDFTNGFHDTANAMATSIASGALRPRVAVLLAGVLNLIGAFLSVQVALTISGGLVDEARITPEVIFGVWSERSCGTCSPGCSDCPRAPRTPCSGA